MLKGGIYKITNTVNGKIYIGSAVDLSRRKRDHFWSLRKGTHCNAYLQKSFNKYGENNFSFEVLSTCLPEFCIELEQFYINIYSESGTIMYNICKTAGSVLGRKMSEETKDKIGVSNSGRIVSENQKKLLRDFNLGKKLSTEHKEKIRIGNLGKKMSDEAKVKISNGNKGKKRSAEICKKLSEAFKKSTFDRTMKDETKVKLSLAHTGKTLSKEHRLKLSESHKGIIPSKETIEKRRQAVIGQKRTKETCLKISLANKGRKKSFETIEKIRKSKLGVKNSEESKLKNSKSHLLLNRKCSLELRQKMSDNNGGNKPVIKYDINGVVIKEYKNLTSAAKDLDVSVGTISLCVNGKQKSTKGFIFKYAA